MLTKVGMEAARLAEQGNSGGAASVLGAEGSVKASTARRDAERANFAATVPGLVEAMSVGSVSGEHTDALARRTSSLTDEQRAAVDIDRLAERAAHLPADTFDALVKRAVEAAKADHGLSDTVAKQAASEFRHWFDHRQGMGKFSGSFDPERYEAFVGAVEAHATHLATTPSGEDGTTRRDANLSARALFALTAGGARGRAGAAVGFVVDAQTLTSGPHDQTVAQTTLGHDLPPESVARLCCDAVLRRVTLDERGVPLSVGRRHRTATDAQWAAIKALHNTCAWHQCERPITWCQLHHILEWQAGGQTDLTNLVPLCSAHHHHVHEGRWRIRLLANRSLEIHRPDGELHAVTPQPTRNRPQLE